MGRNYKKLPRVALAGKRNVGKSTLLNALYGRRRAITDSIAGLTRDILEVEIIQAPYHFLLSDTPGLDIDNPNALEADLLGRALAYINSVDLLLLILEAPSPGPFDLDFIELMRKNSSQTPVIHVINKVDGQERETESLADFYAAGLTNPVAVSAVARWNLKNLLQHMAELVPQIVDPDLQVAEIQGRHPVKAHSRHSVVALENTTDSISVAQNRSDQRFNKSDIKQDESAGTHPEALEISFEHAQEEDLEDISGSLEDGEQSDLSEEKGLLRDVDSAFLADVLELHRSRYADRKDAGIERSSSVISDGRSVECRIAIVGRPNAGKSSLFNRFVQREMALVSDIAGTTRDTIDTVLRFKGQPIRIVDTAGLKRQRARNQDQIEFYSATRTYRAIRDSRVVIHMIDTVMGITDYDKKIAAKIRELSRPVVLAFNKWDAIENKHHKSQAEYLDRFAFLFPYIRNIPYVFCSALDGKRTSRLLELCLDLDRKMQSRIATATLNQQVQNWLRSGPTSSRNLRVYYVSQIETEPPAIVFFVNRKQFFQDNLKQYIENKIRSSYDLQGIPIEILVREKADQNKKSSRGNLSR